MRRPKISLSTGVWTLLIVAVAVLFICAYLLLTPRETAAQRRGAPMIVGMPCGGDLGGIFPNCTVDGQLVRAGTDFPPTPALNDLFYILDDSTAGACDSAGGADPVGTLCRWDGTVWVSSNTVIQAVTVDDMGGIPDAIQTWTNDSGRLMVFDGANPTANRCMEMRPDGGVVAAGEACAASGYLTPSPDAVSPNQLTFVAPTGQVAKLCLETDLGGANRWCLDAGEGVQGSFLVRRPNGMITTRLYTTGEMDVHGRVRVAPLTVGETSLDVTNGYLRTGYDGTAKPLDAACSDASHHGREIFDRDNLLKYRCNFSGTPSGWVSSRWCENPADCIGGGSALQFSQIEPATGGAATAVGVSTVTGQGVQATELTSTAGQSYDWPIADTTDSFECEIWLNKASMANDVIFGPAGGFGGGWVTATPAGALSINPASTLAVAIIESKDGGIDWYHKILWPNGTPQAGNTFRVFPGGFTGGGSVELSHRCYPVSPTVADRQIMSYEILINSAINHSFPNTQYNTVAGVTATFGLLAGDRITLKTTFATYMGVSDSNGTVLVRDAGRDDRFGVRIINNRDLQLRSIDRVLSEVGTWVTIERPVDTSTITVGSTSSPWLEDEGAETLTYAGDIIVRSVIQTSSRDTKEGIQYVSRTEEDKWRETLGTFHPVWFRFKDDKLQHRRLGLILEDLPPEVAEIVGGDKMEIGSVLAYLMGIIGSQERRAQSLQAQINAMAPPESGKTLQAQIADLETNVNGLLTSHLSLAAELRNKDAELQIKNDEQDATLSQHSQELTDDQSEIQNLINVSHTH